MDVDELEKRLRQRQARMMVDFDPSGEAHVLLTHLEPLPGRATPRAGKNAEGSGRTLGEALELGFLLYDGSWKT